VSDFPSFDSPPPGPPPLPPESQPGAVGGPPPGWWQASDGNWYPPNSQPGYGPGPMPMPGPMPGAGYGWVQQGYGMGQRTNGLAIASMVLGILWVYWLGSILAVIFGHVALSQIKRQNQGGRGMAIAGLVLGYIGIAVLVLGIIAVAADPNNSFD
jgi:hypothetical protein